METGFYKVKKWKYVYHIKAKESKINSLLQSSITEIDDTVQMIGEIEFFDFDFLTSVPSCLTDYKDDEYNARVTISGLAVVKSCDTQYKIFKPELVEFFDEDNEIYELIGYDFHSRKFYNSGNTDMKTYVYGFGLRFFKDHGFKIPGHIKLP